MQTTDKSNVQGKAIAMGATPTCEPSPENTSTDQWPKVGNKLIPPSGKVLYTPNPSCPLSFERASRDKEEPSEDYVTEEFALRHYIAGEAAAIESIYLKIQDGVEIPEPEALLFLNEATKAAAIKALSGFGRSDASEVAEEALSISPACPDAHILRALYVAKTFEEALEEYELAEACAVDALKADDFPSYLEPIPAWKYVTTHPYFRAVHGCANTLRKMGRFQESLEKYQLLMRLDDHRYDSKAYVNYHTHVPEVMLQAGDIDGAEKYITDHPDCIQNTNSVVHFVWTRCLIDIIKGRVSSKIVNDFHKLQMYQRNLVEMCVGGYSMLLALRMGFGSHMAVVAGERPLPCGRMPALLGPVDNFEQAVEYGHACQALWSSQAGAVKTALECRDVFYAKGYLEDELPLPGEDGGVQACCTCINSIPDVNLGVAPGGYSLLHAAMLGSNRHISILRALLAKGANLETRFHVQPLHLACYYDAPVSFLKALLGAGAHVKPSTGCAMEVAAIQGNWRCLMTLLDWQYPRLDCPQKQLQQLFKSLLNSDSYACVTAANSSCARCRSVCSNHIDGVPGTQRLANHSSGTSFETCVEVLVNHGLRRYPNMSKQILSANTPLVAHFLYCLDSQGDTTHLVLPKWGSIPEDADFLRGDVKDIPKPAPASARPYQEEYLIAGNKIGMIPKLSKGGEPIGRKSAQRVQSASRATASHSHSHGGAPCNGHDHQEVAPHSHSHSHSHGGVACHGHGPREVPQPRQQHGHSHGGKPCHGHGDRSHSIEEYPQEHGHSHGGVPCHGHGVQPVPNQQQQHGHSHHGHGTKEPPQQQQHGHSHGGLPCHGHGTQQVPRQHGHSHGGAPCHGHGDRSHPSPAPSHSNSHGDNTRPDSAQHGHSHGGVPCHGHGHSHGNLASAFMCANCGRQTPDLQKCSRCKNVVYCGKDCQVAHWKQGHKKVCMK